MKSRLEENTGVLALIIDGVLLAELIKLETNLVAINTSPSKELALVGARQRMMLATINVGDLAIFKGSNLGRLENDGFILAGIGFNADLAEVVQTPAINLTLLVNSKAVVRAASDFDNLATGQTNALGNQRRHLVALNDATAQLVLLATTPSDDVALVVESEHVVGTSGQSLDVLEGGQQHGSGLDLDGLGEAEDTIAGAESAPAVHAAILSQDETGAVAGGDLDKLGAGSEVLLGDGGRCTLVGVDASILIVIIAVLIIIHVAESTVPCCVSAESALVVDAPSQDLVVASQGDGVHTTARDLNDTDLARGEVLVETRALHVDGLLAVDALATQAQFARGALAEDVDIEDLCRRVVDLLTDGGALLGSNGSGLLLLNGGSGLLGLGLGRGLGLGGSSRLFLLLGLLDLGLLGRLGLGDLGGSSLGGWLGSGLGLLSLGDLFLVSGLFVRLVGLALSRGAVGQGLEGLLLLGGLGSGGGLGIALGGRGSRSLFRAGGLCGSSFGSGSLGFGRHRGARVLFERSVC